MRQRVAWLILTSVLILTYAAASAQPTPAQPNPLYLPALFVAPPTPTATATTVATATPIVQLTTTPTTQPSTVGIRSQRSFRDGSFLYVVGEVLNGTDQSIYFAKITARFFNAGGQLVATEDTFTFLTRTAPAQRNPFKLLLNNPPRDIARYELEVTSQNTGILDYRPITVLSTLTRDNFGVEVFGEVRNDQPGEMRSVEVAVAFYDAAGDVIDTDFGFASSTTLQPGTVSTYAVRTFDNIAFTSLNVQAQGYLAP